VGANHIFSMGQSFVALVRHSLATWFMTWMIAMTCADEPSEYRTELEAWRQTREQKLRADNGWLTLVGRYPLQAGLSTLGTGGNNDLVLPSAFEGLSLERLGTLHVDATAGRVKLVLEPGVTMTGREGPFSGERELGSDGESPDWISLDRLSLRIMNSNGRFLLRVADNRAPLREQFMGCIWYPPNPEFRVEAEFVPYPVGKTIAISNMIDEVSEQPAPGYAKFQLFGQDLQLDAIPEGDGLLFVFRDATAGDTTYGTARFIHVDEKPKDHARFVLDFNKAYNPPCAFTAYTVCPLPPQQNLLPLRIEAGERFPQ